MGINEHRFVDLLWGRWGHSPLMASVLSMKHEAVAKHERVGWGVGCRWAESDAQHLPIAHEEEHAGEGR